MKFFQAVPYHRVRRLFQSRPTRASSTSASSPCAACSASPPGRSSTSAASSRRRSSSSEARPPPSSAPTSLLTSCNPQRRSAAVPPTGVHPIHLSSDNGSRSTTPFCDLCVRFLTCSVCLQYSTRRQWAVPPLRLLRRHFRTRQQPVRKLIRCIRLLVSVTFIAAWSIRKLFSINAKLVHNIIARQGQQIGRR